MSSSGNILCNTPTMETILATHPGSEVNPAQAGRTRMPILFLIDVSGSTGEGANPRSRTC